MNFKELKSLLLGLALALVFIAAFALGLAL
jgi:hypothetical protein